MVKNLPANAGGMRYGFDPWFGKIPWRRKWHPLQCSCLESPMDREAWRATIHGVARSLTRLKPLNTTHSRSLIGGRRVSSWARWIPTAQMAGSHEPLAGKTLSHWGCVSTFKGHPSPRGHPECLPQPHHICTVSKSGSIGQVVPPESSLFSNCLAAGQAPQDAKPGSTSGPSRLLFPVPPVHGLTAYPPETT